MLAGPLPHPDILARCDIVLPGAANRILEMAERQAVHRVQLEAFALRHDARRADWGLAAGLIVALAVLGLSGALVALSYQIAGTVLGSIDIVSLVGVFVYGTETRKRERAERIQLLTGDREE